MERNARGGVQPETTKTIDRLEHAAGFMPGLGWKISTPSPLLSPDINTCHAPLARKHSRRFAAFDFDEARAIR